MVKRGTTPPEKIKNDAIAEALLEIRFATSTMPEVFFGRLIDRPDWKRLARRRLPAYDLPAQLRELDANMRYAPTLELLVPEDHGVLRFGPAVLSFHRQPPYGGWGEFKPWLLKTIDTLFATTEDLKITRLGLRYMNGLSSKLHGISSMADFDLKLVVGDDVIADRVNLNFVTKVSDNSLCTVRLASKEFVQGPLAPDIAVFVDVDVYTADGFQGTDQAAVKAWLEDAHNYEKREFFHLFKSETINSWEAK